MLKTLSQQLEDVIHFCRGRKDLMLGTLLAELGSSVPMTVALILSAPFVLFVAVPGLSMVFGLIIFITGARFAAHRSFWIPAFLKRQLQNSCAP